MLFSVIHLLLGSASDLQELTLTLLLDVGSERLMGWSHYGIRMTQERLKTVLLTHEYDDLKKAKMPLRRRNIKLMPISA